MYLRKRVAAVIPAFNEEKSIAKVVNDLWALSNGNGEKIIDEIMVCDNASTDRTAEMARAAKAKVIRENTPGYGIACLTALNAIKPCDIVLFVDGDDSCFVEQSFLLLKGIVNGDDLAIGSRTLGTVERGALTPIQIFGNRLAALLIYFFWQHRITDLGPFRAVLYTALKTINMQDKRYGWTVEMQIKAIQLGFKMGEYPVDSKIRIGESKISGTLKGAIGAGIGILSKIAALRFQQKKLLANSDLGNT